MTVIVGIRDNGKVYMGSDRSASDGDTILQMTTPKIFRVGNFLIGYSGSQGLGVMSKHLRCWNTEPEDIERFLRVDFVKEFKGLREEIGGSDDDHASWLIAYNTYLYEVDTESFSVFPFDYTAIGSGSAVALGSLYSTPEQSPMHRVHKAVNAAIEHTPTCCGKVDTFIL